MDVELLCCSKHTPNTINLTGVHELNRRFLCTLLLFGSASFFFSPLLVCGWVGGWGLYCVSQPKTYKAPHPTESMSLLVTPHWRPRPPAPPIPSECRVRYLGRMSGLAEERGLGCEKSEVVALVVQAAVATAHAVAAGHGGREHRVDSHGEVVKGRRSERRSRFWISRTK